MRNLKRLLLICLIVMTGCVSCKGVEETVTGQYGYRESLKPGYKDIAQPHAVLADMFEQADMVVVACTTVPLEERSRYVTNQLPDQAAEIQDIYTIADCTVLEIIKCPSATLLHSGDTFRLVENLCLKDEKTPDGSVETLLYRGDPYVFPIDPGRPYLIFSSSIYLYGGEEVAYWPSRYGILDIGSREPTEREIRALTTDPDAYRAMEYVEALKLLTQRKTAAAAHPLFAPLFDAYADGAAASDR